MVNCYGKLKQIPMRNGEPRPSAVSGLNLIIKLGECTEEDMKEFRETLPDFGKSIFDRLDEAKKMSLVVLGKMSKEELDAHKNLLKDYGGDYLVGIHNLNNVLFILEQCRIDIDKVLEDERLLINE